MATSGGPRLEGIGRSSSNLVLCLDAHDAASYPGEPATNRLTVTSDYLPTTWGTTSHSAYASVNMRTPVGNKAHKLTLDKDGSNGYYGSPNPCRLTSNSWSNNGLDHYYSIWITTDDWSALDNSTTRYVTGSNGWPSFSATSYKCIAGGREWRLYKGFISNASNTGSGTEYYTFFKNGTYSQNLIFYIAGTMVHQNGNYAVPVASGTRSATDAWKDLSKSGNDGTFANGLGTGVDNARDENVIFPVENCYLDFDGSDDYLDGPTVAPNIGAFTYEAVIYRTSSDFLAVGTGTALGGGTYMQIYVYDAGMRANLYAPQGIGGGWRTGSTIPNTSNTFVNNNIYHITVVNDGTVFYFYKNGVSLGSYDHSYLGNTSSTRLGILRNHVQSVGGTGRVYLARMYNKVLTAAEIKSNFNQLRGRFGL